MARRDILTRQKLFCLHFLLIKVKINIKLFTMVLGYYFSNVDAKSVEFQNSIIKLISKIKKNIRTHN